MGYRGIQGEDVLQHGLIYQRPVCGWSQGHYYRVSDSRRYSIIQYLLIHFLSLYSIINPSSPTHFVRPYTILTSFIPATGQVITKVSEATEEDVDIAVEAAQKAFETTWGLNASGSVRSNLLWKLAELMERDLDELAALEALDNGIP